MKKSPLLSTNFAYVSLVTAFWGIYLTITTTTTTTNILPQQYGK